MKKTTNYYDFPYVTEIRHGFGTNHTVVVAVAGAIRGWPTNLQSNPTVRRKVVRSRHSLDKENIVPARLADAVVL